MVRFLRVCSDGEGKAWRSTAAVKGCDTYVYVSVQSSELGSKQSTKAWSLACLVKMVTALQDDAKPYPPWASRFKGEFGYR